MTFRSKSLLVAAVAVLGVSAAQAQSQHNVILFVPDGLRALAVTPESAPTMAAVRDQGVNFANPHSLFPTFTMANAAGLATGHFLGDTGTFSNTIYTGYPVPTAAGSVTPFIENDAVLGDVERAFRRQFYRRGHDSGRRPPSRLSRPPPSAKSGRRWCSITPSGRAVSPSSSTTRPAVPPAFRSRRR